MLPLSRPTGNSNEALFWQRIYDVFNELSPQVGPRVLTAHNARAIQRRVIPVRPVVSAAQPNICELVAVSSDRFYFGYWYDASRVLHLWNTTQVEHDGIQWARFSNVYTHFAIPCEAAIYCFANMSLCLSNSLPLTSPGPWDYAFQGSPGGGDRPIGTGQYIDIEIVSPRSNCSVFYRTASICLPPRTATFVTSANQLFYESPVNPNPPPDRTPESYPIPIATPYATPY